MRGYELMYILDPTLDEDSTQALIGQIEGFMAKQNVEVESTEPWGKRRMAYRIGRHWDGFYVLSRIRAASLAVAEIERRLRVTEGVLRFITVRFDREQAKLERRRAKKAAEEQARGLRRRPVVPEGGAEVAEAETAGAEGDTDLNDFGGGSEESPDGGSPRRAGRAPEGVAGPEGDQSKAAGEEN